jgi:transcriptional regulator with XRE-family HTH domain
MELHRQRKEIVMPINENIANFIKRYKEERQLSVAELSEELGIAKSAAANYLNGDCNPRADTIELLAKKCGVSATEIISARPPEWKRAEMVERAARLFSSLPPERRDRAIHLFLDLIDALSEDHS